MSLSSGAWRMDLGVDRTQNSLFPTQGLRSTKQILFFSTSSGLQWGFLNASAYTATSMQGRSLLCQMLGLKIALCPSPPRPVIGGGTAGFDKQRAGLLLAHCHLLCCTQSAWLRLSLSRGREWAEFCAEPEECPWERGLGGPRLSLYPGVGLSFSGPHTLPSPQNLPPDPRTFLCVPWFVHFFICFVNDYEPCWK